MVGCSTPYMTDRGRDAADIFTVAVGYGLGTKVRGGPVQVGLLYEASTASLRGGEMSADNREPCLPETVDVLGLIMGMESLHKCQLERNKNFAAGNLNLLPEDRDEQLLLPLVYVARHAEPIRTQTTSCPKSKNQPPPFYYYSQIEVVAALYRSVRLGFNPGELLDFLLGWTTLDIYKDDLEARKKIEQTAAGYRRQGAPPPEPQR